jgi:hypothetical protein
MHGYLTGLNTYDVSDSPSHEKFLNLQIVAEFVQNCGCLIPKHLLLQICGYNETISLGEDYHVNLSLLDAGAEFLPISPYVYQARIHLDGRLSNNFSAKRYHRVAELFERAGCAGKSILATRESEMESDICEKGLVNRADCVPGEGKRLRK